MIKITLTRDEIEQAIESYAKEKILGYDLLRNNSIKVSQGKSASATILIIPDGASAEETAEAVSAEDKEIEKVAGQPDVPVGMTTFG